MVGERDRAAVEPGGRIGRRVRAVHHGHVPERLRCQPVRVQVPPCRHRHPGGRGEQPERQRPAERRPLRRRLPVLHPRAEPAARPLVEGPVADHHLGHARGHREGRLLDGGTGRPAAVVHPGEEGQLAHPAGLGDGDLRAGVHREGDQPVHVGRAEAGVAERGSYGLHREPEFTAAGVLGELGGPDAGDRRASAEGVAGAQAHDPASGTVTVTVPVTWWPRPLAPTTRTTALSPSTSSTLPVSTMVSPG